LLDDHGRWSEVDQGAFANELHDRISRRCGADSQRISDRSHRKLLASRKDNGISQIKAEWAERAGDFVKAKLKESEVTYLELAKRLKKHGFAETEASITNRLMRGTLSATFFTACLAALELEGVVLAEICRTHFGKSTRKLSHEAESRRADTV